MSLDHGALRVGSFTGSVGGLALGSSICLDTFRAIRRAVCMTISDYIGFTVHTYVSSLAVSNEAEAGVRDPYLELCLSRRNSFHSAGYPTDARCDHP